MPISFEHLAKAEKTISRFPGWSLPDREDGVMWFDAPLEIDGVTEQSFFLHGQCRVDLPDENVGLEIKLSRPRVRQKTALARLDWRDIRGGHSNMIGPAPWAGRRVGPTHYHEFELNYVVSEGRMRHGNLPVARDDFDEPATFEELLILAGRWLGVADIGLITTPEWDLSFGL